MDGVMGGAIIGIVGGLIGGLAVLLYALVLQKPKSCPECDSPIPKVLKPKNRRQMLWGGWTCEQCGIEIDRKGKKIEE